MEVEFRGHVPPHELSLAAADRHISAVVLHQEDNGNVVHHGRRHFWEGHHEVAVAEHSHNLTVWLRKLRSQCGRQDPSHGGERTGGEMRPWLVDRESLLYGALRIAGSCEDDAVAIE